MAFGKAALELSWSCVGPPAKKAREEPPTSSKVEVCSGCGLLGHNRAECPFAADFSTKAKSKQESLTDASDASSFGSSDQPLDSTTLSGVARVAEESAQWLASASIYCAKATETSELAGVVETAEHAAQRVAWAAGIVLSYQPQGQALDAAWVESIQNAVKLAKQSSDTALLTCKAALQAQTRPQDSAQQGQIGASETSGFQSGFSKSSRLNLEKPTKSETPCTKFAAGSCHRGDACPFSHAFMDFETKPLLKKRAGMCSFFEQGKCVRGTACTFAHGKDELALITALKDEHEKVREERMKRFARPGDWRCPNCNDLQYAHAECCRRCKTSKYGQLPPSALRPRS